MNKRFSNAIRKKLAQKKRRRVLASVSTILAAVVVFCTAYALMRPAVTLTDGAAEITYSEYASALTADGSVKVILFLPEDEVNALTEGTSPSSNEKENIAESSSEDMVAEETTEVQTQAEDEADMGTGSETEIQATDLMDEDANTEAGNSTSSIPTETGLADPANDAAAFAESETLVPVAETEEPLEVDITELEEPQEPEITETEVALELEISEPEDIEPGVTQEPESIEPESIEQTAYTDEPTAADAGDENTNTDGYILHIDKINTNSERLSEAQKAAVEAYAGEVNMDSDGNKAIDYFDIYWTNNNARVELKDRTDINLSKLKIQIEYQNDNVLAGGVNRKLLVLSLSSLTEGTDGSFAFSENPELAIMELLKNDEGYRFASFLATEAGPYALVSKYVYTGFISNLSISQITDGTAAFNTEEEAVKYGKVDGKDSNGCDTSENNRVVRTFDTIKYDLTMNMSARSATATATEAQIGFEMTLDKDVTEAGFNLAEMQWLLTDDASWYAEYLDEDGNVLYRGEAIGTGKDATIQLYKNTDGDGTFETETSINAIASGSSGDNPYATQVAKQRIVGTTTITNANNVLSGEQTLSAGINVLNATNGSTVAPTFKVWFVGNEDNYGYTGTVTADTDKTGVPEKITANEHAANGDEAVTVSAGDFYNLSLLENTEFTSRNWFDFSTGNEVSASSYTVNGKDISGSEMKALLVALADLTENYDKSDPSKFTDNGNAVTLPDGTSLSDYAEIFSNIRYGRMQGYGVSLNLANLATNGDYGMKGLTLPVGNITLDINFTTSVTASKDNDDTTWKPKADQYYAILWEAEPNVNAHVGSAPSCILEDGKESCVSNYGKWVQDRGLMGRNLYWNNEQRSPYAKGAAPYNQGNSANSCYYGGTWSLSNVGNSTETKTSASTSDGTIYQFTISGYDFDLNDYTFPTGTAGNTENSGTMYGYGIYKYLFSSGYMQVLNVFPYHQSGTANINLESYVGDISVTSMNGSETEDEAENGTITWSSEIWGNDNSKSGTVAIFSPGSIGKRNLFVKDRVITQKSSDDLNNTLSKGWSPNELSGDASAFAGSNIAIMGGINLSPNADMQIYALNILQLFDSHAVSINQNGTGGLQWQMTNNSSSSGLGTVTWLYAADPDFPDGYDMNDLSTYETDKGNYTFAQYMNYVDEEDLVYVEANEGALDADGCITVNGNKLKCIGVLMEARGCVDLWHGTYVNIHIPVTVNGNDANLIGKTTGTVNSFRAWMTEDAAKKMESVSWKNGKWTETENGKWQNTLDGYVEIVPYSKNSVNESSGNGLSRDNDEAPFVKAEYENGNVLANTNKNYQTYGNSLLILDYNASIKIDTTGNTVHNLDSGQYTVDYVLSSLGTETSQTTSSSSTTTLTIRVDLDSADTERTGGITLESGSYVMNGYEISADSTKPTTVTFEVDGEKYTISIYAVADTDGKGVTFILSEVPVGVSLPNITFSAELDQTLNNNDSVTATAKISGAGDVRAYDEVNGNLSNTTISVTKSIATFLSKMVSTRYIEESGAFSYTLTYTNKSDSSIELAYFYDLMPYNGDIRNSDYNGSTYLTDFNAYSTNIDGTALTGDFQANVTIYYSTYGYNNPEQMEYLRSLVEGFNNGVDNENNPANEDAVEEMLADTTYFNVLGWLEKEYETWTENPDGTYYKLKGYDVYTEEVPTEATAKLYESTTTKYSGSGAVTAQYIRNLKTVAAYADDEGKVDTKKYREELQEKITCVYVKVENMGPMRNIVLQLDMDTTGNTVGDVYGNVAHCWLASTAGSQPLISNQVQTTVLSRKISGLVWYDMNSNGVRDENEPLLENVQCDLYKWDSTENKYVLCTTDVRNEAIYPDSNGSGTGSMTTGADGAYSFEHLAAGDYIVAFKGDGLDGYNGVSFKGVSAYQVNGGNDSDTNDGKAVTNTSPAGISGYNCYIAYSESAESIPLHSIADIISGNLALTNSVELVAHQDLGLVTDRFELPKTGGVGTILYTAGGLVLILAAGAGFTCRRRKRIRDRRRE